MGRLAGKRRSKGGRIMVTTKALKLRRLVATAVLDATRLTSRDLSGVLYAVYERLQSKAVTPHAGATV